MKPSDDQLSAQDTPAGQARITQDLTADPIQTAGPSQDEKNSVWAVNLDMAKQTFKSIDGMSAFIPIVGIYVGAVAKVGLAVVHVAETMEGSKEMAKDLEAGISKLSQIVEEFEARSDSRPGDEVAARIQESKKEIERLQMQVQEWESSGRLTKAFPGTEHTDALNECIRTILNALEKFQGATSHALVSETERQLG
ncbi:hypothetical protein FRC01_002499 [Tulasnella sp. 417]|nr:hypothetical protein FRC01_002499 [Tulasnella sp. 417]